MSLLRKLTLVIIGVAIPSLVLYAGAALWFARHGVRESVSQQQVELAQQAMHALDHQLSDQMTQLRLIANSQLLATAANTATTSPATRTALANRFTESMAVSQSWDALRLVRPTGLVDGSSIAAEVGKSFPSAEQYKATIAKALSGELAYSDVFKDPSSGRPTMLMAAPVHNDQDQTTAALVGSVTWSHTIGILQSTEHTAFELFNSQGYELGDSEAKNADEILTEQIPNKTIAAQALAGKEGTAETTSVAEEDEGPVLAAYVQQEDSHAFKSLGWILIAETPSTTAYATINNLRGVLIPTFIGLAIAIYVLILTLIYRALIRPLKMVTEVTRRIAAGDLSSRITLKSSDEVGQLGASFNRMTDKLQELYRGLESKVQSKTGELAERVKESETARARDEAILAGMGEGLIALDKDGQVELVNVTAAELFGIPRDKLFGRPLAELLDGLRDEKDVAIDDRWRPETLAMTNQETVNGTYLYHRYQTDGERISVGITAAPIFSSGALAGVVLVVRDITKEKEIDRMKTEFISLASHQLRTPLSAIKWFSKMLINGDAGKLNDDQTEFATNISDSTERMIELVNSLLNISRIESGRIIVDPHPTDLKQLVSGIVQDLQGKTQEKYQELVISVNDDLPEINLDTHLIGQVYLNLLTNAIKYTASGGKIMVFISRKDDQVITQIADNGVGIPADQQDKIFDKFFRASNVASLETDGTGLGLYLVRAIVESSGGKIWFKSAQGQGTTFWFTLPMAGMESKEGEVVLDE
ncbi:MAG TPA: ATP-binding protein [Candidatus Saccharimonadales bacterium]|nr:ATP-binding protein [Candidatus Saccharimonadales bacterium]